MDTRKLRALEERFFERYPLGFDTDELKEVGRKHKIPQMQAFVKTEFAQEKFLSSARIIESFGKLIGRSSLVSVFEKAKFRDVLKMLTESEKAGLAKGIEEFLYGNQRLGFELMISILSTYKMAKWPILTVLGTYYSPNQEVLIKPTTVKSILSYLEIKDLTYTSRPNYDFYAGFRQRINELKVLTDERLRVENAAFCAFFMLAKEMFPTGSQ